MVVLLCDSHICRLCGDNNSSGRNLYDKISKLDSIVNKYLPLKVKDDGASPRTICPGCHIHLQDTALFFDLIIKGQIKIRQLRIEELSRLAVEKGANIIINSPESNNQQAVLLSNGDASVGEELDVKEFYPVKRKQESEESLQGPKKRGRGRPRKEEKPKNTDETSKLNTIVVGNNHAAKMRSIRLRKIPSRFENEILRGKDLDKILKEVGVTNEETEDEDDSNEQSKEDDLIGYGKTFSGNIIGKVKLIKGNKSKFQTKMECDICNQSFLSMSLFLRHKMKGCCGVFSCTKCASRFDSSESLQNHLDKECQADKERWRCPTCAVTLGTVLELEEHTTTQHAHDKCPFCNTYFQLRRTLESHVTRKHKTKKMLFLCQHCDKMFSNLFTVRYHEASEHPTHLFHCLRCDKKFKVRQSLAKHQLTHGEDRFFSCTICSLRFNSVSKLRSHAVSHALKRQHFICDLCNATFSYKHSLNLHMKIHTGEKPFTCEYCNKSFTQKGNYREHLRVHSGERPFDCDFCPSSFKTSSQLRIHRMLHTGERPYVCEYCDRSFIHKESWAMHTRRHQGIKPFVCHLCSKTFTQLWALKKHLRTHTGEKPYSCDQCGKTFSDCSNYWKHKRKIHEEPYQKHDSSVVYLDLNQLTNQELNDLRLNLLETTTAGSGGCATGESVCMAAVSSSSQPETQISPEVQIQDIKKVDILEEEPRKIVTDEQGNPLTVTMCDGSQLQVTTMDGESLQVLTSDGISIPVKFAPDIDVTPLDQLATFDPAAALNVDVSGSLRELTSELGDDYNVQFVSDDGQDIRLLTSAFNNVSTIKWDLPS